MQRAADFPLCQCRIGGVGSGQSCFRFDRHECIEMRLPFRNPLEAGLRHLTRRETFLRDRIRDRAQRQQCRFRAHLRAWGTWTRRKVAGSRSNGSVPATAAKPSNAGPMELAIRVATSALTGTPATSATALISFAVGLVIRCRLLLLARGYEPGLE